VQRGKSYCRRVAIAIETAGVSTNRIAVRRRICTVYNLIETIPPHRWTLVHAPVTNAYAMIIGGDISVPEVNIAKRTRRSMCSSRLA
jgi:hypothetical protein